jgi:hypothetical protein
LRTLSHFCHKAYAIPARRSESFPLCRFRIALPLLSS